MVRNRLSLKYRIALTIFVLEAIVMSVVLWQTLSNYLDAVRAQQQAGEEVMLDYLTDLGRVALLTDEFASVQPYLESVQRDPSVEEVVLLDARRRVVASSSPVLVGLRMPDFKSSSEHYWRSRQIENEAGIYGVLALEFSSEALMAATARARNLGITIAFFGMILIAVVGVLMGYVLTRRLERLSKAAAMIAQGDYSVRSGETGLDEIAQLGDAFDRMAEEVERDIVELKENQERFSLAVGATNDGIWDWQIRTGEVYFSPRCRQMLGYQDDSAWSTFLDWRDHIHPDDLGRVLEIWAGYMDGNVDNYTIDYRMRTIQGDYLWVRSRGVATRDENGDVKRITGSLADITSQRVQAAALEHQALHDALTGLPNRTLFYDRLNQAIRMAQRESTSLSVLMMDLDRFKDINDTLGHHVGDQLLQRVGLRLNRVLRESDTVARLGGDEFAILILDADFSTATAVAKKIVRSLESPIQVQSHQFEVGASIGISVYPRHGEDADILMQRSDVAMYVAKQAGSGYSIYDIEQDQHSIARLSLVSELRHAINFDQLILYYQPELDLHNQDVIGIEALVRWPHPSRGLLNPDEFIPLAEQTGLIKPLTRWVLNAALTQCSAWLNEGLIVNIAVNLSARNLHEHQLVTDITNMLTIWGIPPSRLTLEITESAIMTQSERAAEILRTLDSGGVQIAIDDFGTGYSSLANLRKLPVAMLKIDRSFVCDMGTDENDAVIVRSTIDLAHNLGMKVVAEGVESKDVWDLLAILNCDSAQGYFICEPMSVEQTTPWLKRHLEARQPAVPTVLRAGKSG